MMKSKWSQLPITRVEFPKLMKHNREELIILFLDYGKGTVVFDCNRTNIGYQSSTWPMGEYADFNGKVTLSNEEGE